MHSDLGTHLVGAAQQRRDLALEDVVGGQLLDQQLLLGCSGEVGCTALAHGMAMPRPLAPARRRQRWLTPTRAVQVGRIYRPAGATYRLLQVALRLRKVGRVRQQQAGCTQACLRLICRHW